MIVLGNEVEDNVTGFNGVAVARIEYLTGGVQYCVKPRAGADRKMPDGEYIDEKQLKLIGPGVHALEKEE